MLIGFHLLSGMKLSMLLNWLSFTLSLHLTLLLLVPCVLELGYQITNHIQELSSYIRPYDVSSLTVKQLKSILDQRGEKYQSTGIEKTDLSNSYRN